MYLFHEVERYFVWAVDIEEPKFANAWLNSAFEWQTLLAALIAGIPAAVGAYLLWRQISLQREELHRIKTKEEASARVKLSPALAALSQHWRTCMAAVLADQSRPSCLPTDALAILMNAAPVFDKDTFEAIRLIISDAQIFDSRYGSASVPMRGGIQEILLIDLARLSLSTDELYPYARYETDTVVRGGRKREDLKTALRSLIRRSGRTVLTANDEQVIDRALNQAFPRKTSHEIPPLRLN